MLEQAELTRSAVGQAQESGMLAACYVVHALANGAHVNTRIRELSARTAELVDAGADLARELAAILDAATVEDRRRASEASFQSSVWLASLGSDVVADRLRERLLLLADQAAPVTSAASDVIGELPEAESGAHGLPRGLRYQQARRRARSLTHRRA